MPKGDINLSHSRPLGFLSMVHTFEYCLLLVKIFLYSYDPKSVLNTHKCVAHSPVNITRVLQRSTLCFSACALAMNTSQTPTVRGILCVNPKCVWSMSGKQNLWSGYLFATIRTNSSLISRCSLPRITITALLSTQPPVKCYNAALIQSDSCLWNSTDCKIWNCTRLSPTPPSLGWESGTCRD